jgi:hypothetical protein
VPLLDYADPAKNASLSKLSRRQVANQSATVDSGSRYGYTLSAEVIQAAKEVAESQPPASWEVDYAAIAAQMRAKYNQGNNDTNSMIQKLVRPNGLLEYTSFDQPNGLQQPLQDTLTKRATSSYWMATMEQNGASPYAPAGYKVCCSHPLRRYSRGSVLIFIQVWRNVMDYGAKGKTPIPLTFETTCIIC